MVFPLSRACLKNPLDVLLEISSNYDFEIYPEHIMGCEDLRMYLSAVSNGSSTPSSEYYQPKNSRITSQYSSQEQLHHQLMTRVKLEQVKSVVKKLKESQRNSSSGKEGQRSHNTTPKSTSSNSTIQSSDVEGKRSDTTTTFYREFELINVEEAEEDQLDSSGPPCEHQLPNRGPSGWR